MYDLLGDGSNQDSKISNRRMDLHQDIDKFIGEIPSLNRYLNMFERKSGGRKRRKNGKRKRNRKRKGNRRKKKNQNKENRSPYNEPVVPKQMPRYVIYALYVQE